MWKLWKKKSKTEAATPLNRWLDRALSQPIPEEAQAFCFLLYEGGDNRWSMELIAASRFDPEDEDWACDEIADFGTRAAPFVWISDSPWEKVLDGASARLKDYLDNGQYAQELCSRQAVGIGFADGDVKLLFVRQ